MPLNFPNSPVLNDTYTYNGKTYVWDGSSWVAFAGSIIKNNIDGGFANSVYTVAQRINGGSANG